jgi:predicted RNA-binding protein (virulence factor B family)
MGLYNTHKLSKLKGCLEDVEDHQSQLVCFTLDACRKLNQTSELAELLKNLYSHLTLADPTYTLTELGISQCKLDDDCHKVLDALKTAQVHCLSMDIMSPEAIKEIFNSIVKHAPNTE